MRKAIGDRTALMALALEAKRRGTSYGKLVAGTTEKEQEEIVQKYERRARKKGKQDTKP